jgi:decaprenyl-phosphate phosphoribosyltransferase
MQDSHADPGSSRAFASKPSVRGHLLIARADHWVKNVFVLPGIIVAASIDRSVLNSLLPRRVIIGLLSVCLISSSNYVLNEILDAPYDRAHPTKRTRPVPSGQVNTRLAYGQWIMLLIAGVWLSLLISKPFAAIMLALWVMGCVYNISPVRSKDLPFVDVLSESINNPLRLLAGWYLTTTGALPPASLVASYWMIGCYFMAIKRFAEYRDFNGSSQSALYRKSFSFYDEPKLLVSITFYGSCAMLFFGAFIMRYRLELILSFPFIALVMAIYLSLAFKTDSAAQRPEKLYREPTLMAAIVVCALVMGLLLFIDVPILHRVFVPSVP